MRAFDGNVENRGFPAAQQRRSTDLAIQTPTPSLGEAELFPPSRSPEVHEISSFRQETSLDIAFRHVLRFIYGAS
jgi:hypothetical protein